MNKKRKKLIRYIYEHIGDCGRDSKIDILNFIAIKRGQDIIYESNDGVCIMFSELENKNLVEIKKLMDEDLEKFKIDFEGL